MAQFTDTLKQHSGVNSRVNPAEARRLANEAIEKALTKAKLDAKLDKEGINVVWEPIPGSSQEIALDSRCHHTLYHGARGPGKTITQLMRFRRNVGKGYGSYWRGVIFDREFKNLADLVAQSKRFFLQFGDGAKFLHGASEYKWVWPTGEELLFRHAKKKSDYDNFHGHEYPFIGWNELTKHPTSELYDRIMSVNRSSFSPLRDTPTKLDKLGRVATRKDGSIIYDTVDGLPLPPIPLEVFSTTNPNGPGHNWVKLRFITPAKNGEVLRTEVQVFNPQTQQDEIVVKTQVAIFGSYRENIYLPPEYVAELEQISDPNLRAAWLMGSWDVNAGGAFDDLFSHRIHVLPRFPIPDDWYIDRSFDWGSSHPFSTGWWAEANGEEITLPDGSTFCPAPGSLIQIGEWYGCAKGSDGRPAIGTNKGLKMSAPDVAEGIKSREIVNMANGWYPKQPAPGPADNQIADVRESDVDTIEKKMAKKGVRWTKSDKSKGSRKNGFQLLRDRLEAAMPGKEGPAIYFMTNCVASITLLPGLPRSEKDPDDVDTDAEDHAYDMIRYRVLKGNNRMATQLHVSVVN